jgi:predicted transcriptional regulator of viral defense system
MMKPHLDRASQVPAVPSVFRPRDLDKLELSRTRLRSMLRAGEVDQIGRGLYRYHAVEPTELETVATICARVPHAIVCLLSALLIHRIGTQLPNEVWIALDNKARKPRIEDLPVRIVRFSGPMLRYGIEERVVQGVTVRITSPARTVVDCFRYRNKLGLDVALEALKDAIQQRRTTVDAITRAAEFCRAGTVIKPYLEAVLA